MKLLLDQNLSHRLMSKLGDEFRGSLHVRDVRLSCASDDAVWQYARENGLVLLSKDSDFQQRALLHGHPPKVVWLRVGNCTTDTVARLICDHVDDIRQFVQDDTSSFLALS